MQNKMTRDEELPNKLHRILQKSVQGLLKKNAACLGTPVLLDY